MELDLFTGQTQAEKAIERILEFEQFAVAMNPAGYYVAFSGGKDSQVVLDLVRRSGVKYEAHMNLTTVDPPELLRFVRKEYPDVQLHKPAMSMFRLIEKNYMPPTFRMRYCCKILKEQGGVGRFVVTGVRWAESAKRKTRRMVEACYKDKTRRFLHAIIDWSETDVWDYIRGRGLKYCSLYDEGFDRIGCVGCPLASMRQRRAEFRRWPRFKRAYIRACDRAVAAMDGMQEWQTGQDMFDWWMSESKRKGVPENVHSIFGD